MRRNVAGSILVMVVALLVCVGIQGYVAGGTDIFLQAPTEIRAEWRIKRVAADGGTPVFTAHEVTDLTYFDLGPDGKYIAFGGIGYSIQRPLDDRCAADDSSSVRPLTKEKT